MRGHTEIINLLTDKPLTAGAPNVVGENFSLGEGWLWMMLTVETVLTVGTASGPVTEGELLFIKAVSLTTDRDGEIIEPCPGRGLYYLAKYKSGVTPHKDAIAAASATYKTCLPIFFSNPLLLNPNDSILDTSRYKSMQLIVTLGTLADLFGTPGTATATYKLQVDVCRTMGALPPEVRPKMMAYIKGLPQINPASQTFIDLPKSKKLALLMALVHAGNSVSSGVGFSGTSANNILSKLNIRDNFGYVFSDRYETQIRAENLLNYKIISGIQTGFYAFDFALERSVFGAYPTGDKSEIRINWVNDTLSSSGISALIDGLKDIRV